MIEVMKIMARFWEHLKYHEDTVVKRPITMDEIEFLSDLQKEMNTQDHCGTADPRYWVIRDFKDILVGELEGDGIVIFDPDAASNVYEGEFNADEIIKSLSDWFDTDDFNSGDVQEYSFESTLEIEEYLEDKGYGGMLWISNYKTVEKYEYFFLTEKAAADYLRENAHHHSANATTYCMYSWRSPEEEKLWKILHEVDWKKIKELMQDGND